MKQQIALPTGEIVTVYGPGDAYVTSLAVLYDHWELMTPARDFGDLTGTERAVVDDPERYAAQTPNIVARLIRSGWLQRTADGLVATDEARDAMQYWDMKEEARAEEEAENAWLRAAENRLPTAQEEAEDAYERWLESWE